MTRTHAVLLSCATAMLCSPLLAQERPYGVGKALDAEFRRVYNSGWPADPDYDQPPQLLVGYKPLYPISRLMSGTSGSCEVVYTIDSTGGVADTVIARTDDEKMCAHAIIALRHWRFSPAIKDGAAVPMRVLLPFDFRSR